MVCYVVYRCHQYEGFGRFQGALCSRSVVDGVFVTCTPRVMVKTFSKLDFARNGRFSLVTPRVASWKYLVEINASLDREAL